MPCRAAVNAQIRMWKGYHTVLGGCMRSMQRNVLDATYER